MAAMSDWLERYVEALVERMEVGGPEPGLQSGEKKVVLDLARVVAHGTERKNAPLATFIAGRYTALREERGASRSEAMTEAIEVARALLGPSEE